MSWLAILRPTQPEAWRLARETDRLVRLVVQSGGTKHVPALAQAARREALWLAQQVIGERFPEADELPECCLQEDESHHMRGFAAMTAPDA